MKEKLEKEIKKFAKAMKKGDCACVLYKGQEIGRYEFNGDLSPDTKTPLQWLRGIFCFEINFKGRDINYVELKIN